jgi:hypothetical protein
VIDNWDNNDVVNDGPRLRIWLYRRTAPGQFQPIPIRTWDEWVYGRAPLPPSEDGFVWYVTVQVWMLNRRVVELGAVDFLKARVNASGLQEDEMRFAEMALALRALDEQRDSASTGPVIDASHRFAQRSYRWRPTAEDLRRLRDVVNRRAGWKAML